MKNIIFIITIILLCGCTRNIPNLDARLATASSAADGAMTSEVFDSGGFSLFGYRTDLRFCSGKTLDVYIEGDGLSWITSSLISDDPTPLNPMALKLASKDPSPCRLYLARPCQYVGSAGCNDEIWTDRRFAPEVVATYQKVLDEVMDRYRIKDLRLTGYSGGGAVAALVASERSDVRYLVTVAGNLDIRYWTKEHGLWPLEGSLNPADRADRLENIKQLHIIGGDDKIIDSSVFMSYRNKFEHKENIKYLILDGFGHNSDWASVWQTILKDVTE